MKCKFVYFCKPIEIQLNIVHVFVQWHLENRITLLHMGNKKTIKSLIIKLLCKINIIIT